MPRDPTAPGEPAWQVATQFGTLAEMARHEDDSAAPEEAGDLRFYWPPSVRLVAMSYDGVLAVVMVGAVVESVAAPMQRGG